MRPQFSCSFYGLATHNTHPKLPHLRGGSERDRDSDRLSFTPLPVTPRHSRSGDSLLGSGGRLSLSSSSPNRPPSRCHSRSHSRSVRRWVHARAIRTPIGSGDVVRNIVTCSSGGWASSDSCGRTPPRRKRDATRGLRKSAGGSGGSEVSALLGSHERNVRCDRASACGARFERELSIAGV
jgi:hypothetical protein